MATVISMRQPARNLEAVDTAADDETQSIRPQSMSIILRNMRLGAYLLQHLFPVRRKSLTAVHSKIESLLHIRNCQGYNTY